MANSVQYYFASNILQILTVLSAKGAMILLVVKINVYRNIAHALYALAGFSIAWAIASIVVTALQCSPDPWTLGPGNGTTCFNQYWMQIAIRGTDALGDIFIGLAPIFVFNELQMKHKTRLVLMLLFGLRVL